MAREDQIQTVVAPSPRGQLLLVATEIGLCGVEFLPAETLTPETLTPESDVLAPGVSVAPILKTAVAQIDEYFSGSREVFDLPLDLRGTPFQKEVWRALLGIPFGARTSYGAIAAEIGRPTAVRAVGGAIGRNPLLFVVPCHRVVAKNGALTGFSAGMGHKQWLLSHEEALLSTPSLGITEA